MTIDELIKSVNLEGFSVDRDGRSPTEGYMVGIEGLGITERMPYNEHLIRNWFVTNAVNVEGPFYYGGWKDKETGILYLDISRNVPTLSGAVAMGRENHQVSIWDVVNGVEVFL